MAKYKFLVCGGTFDLLHKGHKDFIGKALESAEKVLIGITSDSYIRSFKNGINIEAFAQRKRELENFIKSINAQDKVEIVSINSAYEPFLETSKDYDAIIVTPQTEKVALELNIKRKQNGLNELGIITTSMTLADDGKEISSTRIRKGEINREGRLYINSNLKGKILVLPEEARRNFQEPIGEVISEIPKNIDGSKIITIGDITTQRFNLENVNQFLSIVDFLVHRDKKFSSLSELGFDSDQGLVSVQNSPSSITPELFMAIREVFNDKNSARRVILVNGEEDLAVLAVLLLAPLGYYLFYGQPDKGLVKAVIDERVKEKSYALSTLLKTA